MVWRVSHQMFEINSYTSRAQVSKNKKYVMNPTEISSCNKKRKWRSRFSYSVQNPKNENQLIKPFHFVSVSHVLLGLFLFSFWHPCLHKPVWCVSLCSGGKIEVERVWEVDERTYMAKSGTEMQASAWEYSLPVALTTASLLHCSQQ